MAQASAFFAEHFGVVRRANLLDQGFTPAQINQGLKNRKLERVRNGWYMLTSQPPHSFVLNAVRAGAALSGATALAMRGAWDLKQTSPTHRVARRQYSRRGTKTIVLPRTDGRYVPVTQSVDPIDLAFETCLQTLSTEDLICIGDSLARRKLITIDEMQSIAANYSAKIRSTVSRINDKADSGIETYVRLWLERNRIQFMQQVPMVVIEGRIDFLIGNRLVLEVDGREFHSSKEDRQRDYRRDQILQSIGYTVFRVTYEDVMNDWDVVSQRLLQLIRRREHRPLPALQRQKARY